ncbi:MAG TPA: hypothetical protein VFP50_15465 [Anaeromyxobacteraceae bacterium]|nr:hypothetical protein [Anaeromyxobacteraceae bacterium]
MAERPDPKLVGAIVAGVVVALGGGAGGYLARGTPEKGAPVVEHVTPERVENLERWRAAREALDARDREERQQLVAAIQDLSKTNGSLRDAVLVVTERQGTVSGRQEAMEARLRALEQAVTTRSTPKR